MTALTKTEIRTIISQIQADIKSAFCREEVVELKGQLNYFQQELQTAAVPDEIDLAK